MIMDNSKFVLPTTKGEALTRGCMLYYTGKPCRSGHTSVRYRNGGKCKACTKERKVRKFPDYEISDTRQRIEKLKETPDFEESWD